MSVLDQLKVAGAKKALAYIEKDPDKNIPRIIEWMIKFNVAGSKHNDDLLMVREYLADQNSNWYRLIKSLWTDVDTGIRKAIFENLIINVGITREEDKETAGGELPMAIMLDQPKAAGIAKLPAPTKRTTDEYDLTITRCKSRKIFAFIFTGGFETTDEESVRKLARIHKDCMFVIMMDPDGITPAFADMVLTSKNIVPMLRDGAGMLEAMAILRERKILFGAASGCSDENAERIKEGGFTEEAVDGGAKALWLFEEEGQPLSEENSNEIYKGVLLRRRIEPILEVCFMQEEQFVGGRVEGSDL